MAGTGEIEKANARPIDGPYPDLAREVRRLLGHEQGGDRPYLTSREASRVTGVNHATITTTVRGDRPSEGTILKLAKGLDGDAGLMLSLAGYPVGRYVREDTGRFPHDEHEGDRQAAYAAREEVIRKLADVHRVGRGPEFVGLLDPAAGYLHTAVTGNWEAYVLPILMPLLPYTTRSHYARVAEDYLRALDEGDSEAIQLERSFQDLLLNCIRLAEVERSTDPRTSEPGNRNGEEANRLTAELDRDGRRNRLALAAWYERRHDREGRLPQSHILISLLSPPPQDFRSESTRLDASDDDPDARRLSDWYRLVTEMREMWPAPGDARQAEAGLEAALRGGDPQAHILGLAYLGLLIAAGHERAHYRALTLRSMPGTAPFARALTKSLIAWWQSTGQAPAPPDNGAN